MQQKNSKGDQIKIWATFVYKSVLHLKKSM